MTILKDPYYGVQEKKLVTKESSLSRSLLWLTSYVIQLFLHFYHEPNFNHMYTQLSIGMTVNRDYPPKNLKHKILLCCTCILSQLRSHQHIHPSWMIDAFIILIVDKILIV